MENQCACSVQKIGDISNHFCFRNGTFMLTQRQSSLILCKSFVLYFHIAPFPCSIMRSIVNLENGKSAIRLTHGRDDKEKARDVGEPR